MPFDPLYKNLGILDMSEINLYITGMFKNQIIYHNVPYVFDDSFI